MENFVPIELQLQRDFSKKINITFAFLRQNIGPLSKSLFYIAGPPVLLSSALIGNAYGKFLSMSVGRRPGAMNVADDLMSSGFIIEMVAGMIIGIIALLFTVSVVNNYLFLYDEKKSNKIETSEVWDRVRDTFWQYLGMIASYMALMILVVGVAVGLVALLVTVALPLAILTGFVLFFVFYYLVINCSLIFIVQPYEQIGFFKAVGRSFWLIRNKWWSTFGILFITSLIAGSIAYVFFIPWYATLIYSTIHSLETNSFQEPSTLLKIVGNIFLTLYFLASYFLHTITLVGLAFQYFNLVELKEARGLMSRINTVGQSAPPANTADEQY